MSFYAPPDDAQGEWVAETLQENNQTIIAGLYSIGEIDDWKKADDRAETLMLQYAERNWKDPDYNMTVDGFLSDLSVNLKDAESFAAFLKLNGMFDDMTDEESSVFSGAGEALFIVHQRIAEREALNADNAPELLECLQWAMHGVSYSIRIKGQNEAYCDAIDRARAAIAKATGAAQ